MNEILHDMVTINLHIDFSLVELNPVWEAAMLGFLTFCVDAMQVSEHFYERDNTFQRMDINKSTVINRKIH